MVRRNVTGAPAALQSWAGVDTALGTIRALEAEIAAGQAAKDAALQALQQEHDAAIVPKIEQRDALAKGLEEFVTLHQGDLGDARSKKLNHGRVGFRLGLPAVKTLKNWTLKKALEALENAKKRGWIAVKKSVDKAAILKAKPEPSELKPFGLEIGQEERFYYETEDTAAVNPESEAA